VKRVKALFMQSVTSDWVGYSGQDRDPGAGAGLHVALPSLSFLRNTLTRPLPFLPPSLCTDSCCQCEDIVTASQACHGALACPAISAQRSTTTVTVKYQRNIGMPAHLDSKDNSHRTPLYCTDRIPDNHQVRVSSFFPFLAFHRRG
jgi:hypothetical protein